MKLARPKASVVCYAAFMAAVSICYLTSNTRGTVVVVPEPGAGTVTAAQNDAASPSEAIAAELVPNDPAALRLDAMLRSGHADPSVLSAFFLSKISVAQLDAILGQIRARLGEYRGLSGARGDFIARFAKGTDEVTIHLDADGKIDGLFFKPPRLQVSSLEEGLRALRALPGTLSYALLEENAERQALEPSTPLAVGSTFKLAVLAALRDQVAQGSRRWSDVVPLQSDWKSLPSGVLQDWPSGTPLTLATYATAMISISDNTAADALIRKLGPAALAPYASRNVPFLTTREMFTLKSSTGAQQAANYLTARTPEARLALVRMLDAMPLPPVGDLLSKPLLDIEWHYSARELCDLMRKVADLPLMSINPGVADAAAFAHIAYKGGSDLGAINMTTQLTTKRGTIFCFSATLNDTKAVEDTAFSEAYGSVLGALVDR